MEIMDTDFKNDFAASVAQVLFNTAAFLTAFAAAVYFWTDTGSLFATLLGTLTVGLFSAVAAGFAAAVAGTPLILLLAWLVRRKADV